MISSFPRHQITNGFGVPLTVHLSSVISFDLAIFGFTGCTNVGASPSSSFSM